MNFTVRSTLYCLERPETPGSFTPPQERVDRLSDNRSTTPSVGAASAVHWLKSSVQKVRIKNVGTASASLCAGTLLTNLSFVGPSRAGP